MPAIIRMVCPNLKCKKVLGVPGTARGKTVVCKGCGTPIRVPMPAAPKSAPVIEAEPEDGA